MAFHSNTKTTARDLDHVSNLTMNWINFWKSFDQIDTGSLTFLSLRGEYEKLEDEGSNPPWETLRKMRS